MSEIVKIPESQAHNMWSKRFLTNPTSVDALNEERANTIRNWKESGYIEQSPLEQARHLSTKIYLGAVNLEMHDEVIADRNKIVEFYEQHIKKLEAKCHK